MSFNGEKALAAGLVRAVDAFVTVAKRRKAKLPVDHYDVIWFKDRNGQEQRKTRSKPLHRVEELRHYWVPDFLSKLTPTSTASGVFNALGKLAESIANRGLWPVGISRPSGHEAFSVLLLSVYLSEKRALSVDKAIAEKVASQFVDDVCSDFYSASSIYLVTNFEAPRSFQLDKNVRFRPIGMRDFEEFGAVDVGGHLDFDRPWLNSRDWICQAFDKGIKSSWEPINRHSNSIEEVMGALNLNAEGQARFQLLRHGYASPFFASGFSSSGNIMRSGGTGDKLILDKCGVKTFAKNYALVKEIFSNKKLERAKLPFRRLRFAASRSDDEDRIVDYVVALERLLAPDANHLEITFRFRLRGAPLLPSSFGDVPKRQKLMAELYGLRSNIVHGKAKPDNVAEMAPKAERVAKAIFLWFASRLRSTGHEDLVKQLDDALVAGASNWAGTTSEHATKESPEGPSPFAGGQRGCPPVPFSPPSPAGEGGQGDEVHHPKRGLNT